MLVKLIFAPLISEVARLLFPLLILKVGELENGEKVFATVRTSARLSETVDEKPREGIERRKRWFREKWGSK